MAGFPLQSPKQFRTIYNFSGEMPIIPRRWEALEHYLIVYFSDSLAVKHTADAIYLSFANHIVEYSFDPHIRLNRAFLTFLANLAPSIIHLPTSTFHDPLAEM